MLKQEQMMSLLPSLSLVLLLADFGISGLSSSNATNSSCRTTWETRLDRNWRGSTSIAIGQHPDDCKRFCIRAVNCLAVDVVGVQTLFFMCWLHFNASEDHSSPGVTHFRLTKRCAANVDCDPWLISEKTHLGNGVHIGIKARKECLEYCWRNLRCIAVDIEYLYGFSVDEVSCWIHTEVFDLLIRGSAENVVLYEPVRNCLEFPGHFNSAGEIIDMSKKTISSEYPPLDISPNSKPPAHVIGTEKESQTVATGNTGPRGPSGRTGATGATGHPENTGASEPCGSQGSPVAQGPPGRPGARGDPGLMGPPGPPPAGCQPAWTNFLKSHSFGGQPVMSLGSYSLNQCKMSCLGYPSCFAIDFDRLSSVCYVHTDPNNLRVRQPNNDVDQYVLDRCHSNGGSYGSYGKLTGIPFGVTPQALESSNNSFDFQDAVNPAIVAAATSLLSTCLVMGIAMTIFAVRRRQLGNRDVALVTSASLKEPTCPKAQSTLELVSA